MQNKVEICGVNTSKLKVLKNDETQALLLRAKQGDMKAREELIAGNLRLVLSVIQRFANRGENADDLFQVGCIGLIKAIDNFNTDLDVRFSTYGVPMIVGEIRRYLRDNSTMRVSRAMRDTAYKVLQAKEALYGRAPAGANRRGDSQDAGAQAGGRGLCPGRHRGPGLPLRAGVLRQRGHHLRHGSGAGQQKHGRELAGADRPAGGHCQACRTGRSSILSLRFFQGKTQMEVSTEVGISQAQVSRLEKNALRQIKKDL